MDARLTFPSAAEAVTDELPDDHPYKVKKHSRTTATRQDLVSHVGPTTVDAAKSLEKRPPSPARTNRDSVTIPGTTRYSAPPSTASAPSQKASTASSRDRIETNLGRLSMHMNRRSKSGNLPGKTRLPPTTPAATKTSFWTLRSARRSRAVPTDGDEETCKQ
jgi:hypothetical protein